MAWGTSVAGQMGCRWGCGYSKSQLYTPGFSEAGGEKLIKNKQTTKQTNKTPSYTIQPLDTGTSCFSSQVGQVSTSPYVLSPGSTRAPCLVGIALASCLFQFLDGSPPQHSGWATPQSDRSRLHRGTLLSGSAAVLTIPSQENAGWVRAPGREGATC